MRQRALLIISSVVGLILFAFWLMSGDGENTAYEVFIDKMPETETCMVVGSRVDVLRANIGLGRNRATRTFLANDGVYPVLGMNTDDVRHVPWYLVETDLGGLWVAKDDVFTKGDCTGLDVLFEPPVLPRVSAFTSTIADAGLCDTLEITDYSLENERFTLNWDAETNADYYIVDIFNGNTLRYTIPVESNQLEIANLTGDTDEWAWIVTAYTDTDGYQCAVASHSSDEIN